MKYVGFNKEYYTKKEKKKENPNIFWKKLWKKIRKPNYYHKYTVISGTYKGFLHQMMEGKFVVT